MGLQQFWILGTELSLCFNLVLDSVLIKSCFLSVKLDLWNRLLEVAETVILWTLPFNVLCMKI